MQGGRPNPHGPRLSVNLPLVWIAQGLFESEWDLHHIHQCARGEHGRASGI